jgi:two-component system chemotaxis response regulator CheY
MGNSLSSVLVADPDPDACLLYASTLQIHEDQVRHAIDGRDALAKALASPFSLMITETRLPFIDGFSLCEILRRDRVTQGVPILVVTADARADVFERAVRAGADGAIVKPFEPALILSEAQRVIRRARDAWDRSAQLLVDTAGQRARAAEVRQQSESLHRRRKKDAYERFATSRPPNPPPIVQCPMCDRRLGYVSSEVGGVSHTFAEQWDYYACPRGCGRYQYRHRTRKLRAV